MGREIPCIIRRMTKLKYFQLFLVLSVFAAVISGCARQEVRTDIVLVTVEGNVGSCESMSSSTAELFPNAYTTSPSTLPAAASVLTGLLPTEHGLRVNGVGSLSREKKTLAMELCASGFECTAFLSSAALDPRHGLTNGFVRYELKGAGTARASARTRSPTVLVDAVAEYLKTAETTQPKFVWVHLSPYAGVSLTNEVALSEAESSAQQELDRLFGLFPVKSVKAVVPLFGIEKGRKFRGMSLGDPATRVTMAVSGHGRTGIHEDVVSIADIKNLILNPKAEVKSHTVYSETVMPWYVFRLPPLQIVRGSVPTLPSLGLGRVESQVLASQAEMRALKINGHLGEGLIPAYTNANGVASMDKAGQELLDRAGTALSLSGADGVGALKVLIKDNPGIPVFHEWLGNLQWQLRDYTEACNEYAKVSEYGINMIGAYRQQSMCHTVIGNIPQAIDKAENAFLLNPEDPVLRRGLSQLLLRAGSALLSQKQYLAAGECLNRVYWLEPRNTDALMQLANLQLEIGQTNAAIGLLKGLLTIKPEHVMARRMLETIGR